MPSKISRSVYADMFGPTTGDRACGSPYRSHHRSAKMQGGGRKDMKNSNGEKGLVREERLQIMLSLFLQNLVKGTSQHRAELCRQGGP